MKAAVCPEALTLRPELARPLLVSQCLLISGERAPVVCGCASFDFSLARDFTHASCPARVIRLLLVLLQFFLADYTVYIDRHGARSPHLHRRFISGCCVEHVLVIQFHEALQTNQDVFCAPRHTHTCAESQGENIGAKIVESCVLTCIHCKACTKGCLCVSHFACREGDGKPRRERRCLLKTFRCYELNWVSFPTLCERNKKKSSCRRHHALGKTPQKGAWTCLLHMPSAA